MRLPISKYITKKCILTKYFEMSIINIVKNICVDIFKD